ncbi:hypothetical protein CRUP_008961 [Coryphaenoides rupestris]|nr:hypothetical protein CRUP_008961 [Coryphaenoides rupestris]
MNLRRRFNETQSVRDRARPGSERVTTEADDRYIVMQHLRDRFQTAAQTAAETPGRRQPHISTSTGLQRNADKQTLEEVMSQLFQVIPPPSLDLWPRPSRCHRCAVVGNSGNLRRSGHGKLIDSHSAVIRMNKAVTSGFEEDVGNRTTHHFLYPESAVDIVGGASLVLLPFKVRDLEWLASALSTGRITM